MSVWTLDEVKVGRVLLTCEIRYFNRWDTALRQALDDCNGGGNAAAVRKYLRKVTPKDRVKQAASRFI